VVDTANDNVGKPALGSQRPKGVSAAMWRALVKLRRMLGSNIPENAAEAKEAVSHFLSEMSSVAARTYPAWSRILTDGLSEYSLTYDERRNLFEIHPIDDYYFAGIVALEAVKIRGLYTPAEATELLSEIGEQVDAAAGRQDRIVSDMVFAMLGSVDMGTGIDRMKTPYDRVVKIILKHIGIHKIEATRELMRDKGFRHLLGEPLALGVPQWWRAFQAKFSIYWSEPEEPGAEETEIALQALAAAVTPPPLRRGMRRRATSFLGG